MRTKTLLRPIFSLALLTGTLACDVDDSKSQGEGTLLMKLTDAPLDDVDSVFVTFSEVAVQRCVSSAQEAQAQAKEKDAENGENAGKGDKAVGEDQESQRGDASESSSSAESAQASGASSEASAHYDASGESQKEKNEENKATDAGDDGEDEKKGACEHGVWEVLKLGDTTKFDLLTLQNGKTADLGFATLPAGAYGQIRLKLDAAELVVKGETLPLTVPSGMQSGLKIVGGFEVASDKQTELTVDFDAGLSVKYIEGAGWKMKPVIRLLK